MSFLPRGGFVALGLVIALAEIGGSVPAGSAQPAPPLMPSNVHATAKVGQIKVSWTSSVRQASYTVQSFPQGLSCTTTSKWCTFPATRSTPWQFTVRAQNPTGRSPWSAPSPVVAQRTLLILAGQSNATGWESYAVDPPLGTNYFSAPYTNGADLVDRIEWLPWLVLPGAGRTWTTLSSPQRWNWPGIANHPTIFGPEVGLARQLWADTGRSAFILKETYPGSSLQTTWNIAGGPESVAPQAIAHVLTTMKKDARAGVLDTIGGIYWVQGEADAEVPSAASTYLENLTTLISTFRTELPMSPDAPFAIAKIDLSAFIDDREQANLMSAETAANYRTGNDRERSADDAATLTVPGTIEVDTKDLPRVGGAGSGHHIHLTNQSELMLGELFASATEGRMP